MKQRDGKCVHCGNAVEGKHDREDCPWFDCGPALVAQQMIDAVADLKERERVTGRCYPYPGSPRLLILIPLS